MKMSKLILAGALVLLASVVVIGCKPISGGDTAALEKISNGEYLWKQSNPSNKEFIRVYQQFGTVNQDEAVIEVTAKWPESGWSGVAFLMGKNATDNKKNDFYILALRRTAAGKNQIYISQYVGVDPQANLGEEMAVGTGKDIIDTIDLPDGYGIPTTGDLKFCVKIVSAEGGVKLSLGPTETVLHPLNLTTEGNKVTLSAAADTTATGLINTTVDNSKPKGGIGLYGQLTKSTKTDGTGPSTETRYKVLLPKTVLSAEDAE